MSLISVIVPIYRVEPYLDRCVESLTAQRFSDLEILLIDDGSPDACGAMCDSWARRDRRIRVIHRENGGLSRARNTGLAAARGRYIAFVDGDDYVHPQFLSALYQAVKRSGAQIGICAVEPFLPGQCPKRAERVASESVLSAREALADMLCGRLFHRVVWNKLYDRSVLEGLRFPPDKCREDEFFTYRAVAAARTVAVVDTPLYFYLRRADGLMHAAPARQLDALEAYRQRLDFLRGYDAALYRMDRLLFCEACAYFYRMSYRAAQGAAMRASVRAARREVRLSLRELLHAPMRRRLYALATGCCMGAFCRALTLWYRLRGVQEDAFPENLP